MDVMHGSILTICILSSWMHACHEHVPRSQTWVLGGLEYFYKHYRSIYIYILTSFNSIHMIYKYLFIFAIGLTHTYLAITAFPTHAPCVQISWLQFYDAQWVCLTTGPSVGWVVGSFFPSNREVFCFFWSAGSMKPGMLSHSLHKHGEVLILDFCFWISSNLGSFLRLGVLWPWPLSGWSYMAFIWIFLYIHIYIYVMYLFYFYFFYLYILFLCSYTFICIVFFILYFNTYIYIYQNLHV